MNGTIIQNGVTVNTSTDNIIIPSDGMYEIDFIATIVDNGLNSHLIQDVYRKYDKFIN